MHYLIWSNEHRAWWKPGGWGYTTATHRAGRYSYEQACKILKDSNRYDENEIAVEAPSRTQLDVDLAEDGISVRGTKEADEARDRSPELAPSPAGAAPGEIQQPSDAGEQNAERSDT